MTKNGKRPDPPSPVMSPTACTPSGTKKTHFSSTPDGCETIKGDSSKSKTMVTQKQKNTVELLTFEKVKTNVEKSAEVKAPKVRFVAGKGISQVPVTPAEKECKVPKKSSTGLRTNPVTGETVCPAGGRWSKHEDTLLRGAVEKYGPKNWKKISEIAFGCSRTDVQCLHRWQKVLKPGLVKGPWTEEEDKIVSELVLKHGVGNIKWSVIAAQLPGRLGKQARERWYNHLDTDLNKEPWTKEEDEKLMALQKSMGNRWCEIAKLLTGRSENAVKNRWNSAMRKRAQALKHSNSSICKKNAKTRHSVATKASKPKRASKNPTKTSSSKMNTGSSSNSKLRCAKQNALAAGCAPVKKRTTRKKKSQECSSIVWGVDDEIMKEFNFDMGFDCDMLTLQSPPPELSTINVDFFDSPEAREIKTGRQKKTEITHLEDEMNLSFKDWSEEKLDFRVSLGSDLSNIFSNEEVRKKRISLDSTDLLSDVSVSPTVVDFRQLRMTGTLKNQIQGDRETTVSPSALFTKHTKSPCCGGISPTKNNFLLTEDMLDKISANWFPSDIANDEISSESSPTKLSAEALLVTL